MRSSDSSAPGRALQLACPTVSDTGAYRLTWQGPADATFRLIERDADAGARVVYEGAHTAATVSGRLSGARVYQVGVVAVDDVSAWSDPCQVEVRPPSMALALALFGVGLAVCAAIVVVIVLGHRAHRRGAIG